MWKCDICECSNDDALTECARCDIPRDHEDDVETLRRQHELSVYYLRSPFCFSANDAGFRPFQFGLRTLLILMAIVSMYFSVRAMSDRFFKSRNLERQWATMLRDARIKQCDALYFACGSGSVELAKRLLDEGDPATAWGPVYIGFAEKPSQQSALALCSQLSNRDLVELLLKNGADPNATRNSSPPLAEAIRTRNYEVAKLLVEHGADVNLPDVKCGAANMLWLLCEYCEEQMSSTNGVLTVSGTRDEFIDLILEKTIDVNAVSIVHGPNPALWRAIAHHRVYYVQRLLERGAALKNGPSSALSTLTWVLRSFGRQHREQFIEIAALLLKAGADPNEDRIMFNTIGTRCPEVLEMLLDHGADCNIRLEDGTSLLDFATKQGNQDVIKLLIEHGAQ